MQKLNFAPACQNLLSKRSNNVVVAFCYNAIYEK